MMTSQIFKFMNLTKMNKSNYLENETLVFFQSNIIAKQEDF